MKVFFIFPIRRDRVMFTAYSGKQFSCNPKYIFEEMRSQEIDFEPIWAFSDLSQIENKPNSKIVKYKSFEYIYYVLTSRVVVENFESWSLLPARKGQDVINTWHGGGAYKKVGVDRKDARSFNDKLLKYKNNRITLYLSSGEAFTKMTIRDSFNYSGEVASVGMPRNDIFFKENELVKNNIRKKLGLDDQKVLIVAPTFRTKSINDMTDLDFDKLITVLINKFGGEWVVLFRSHYYEKIQERDFTTSVIDVSRYPDMQELLLISDILITDYSSSMWDFSLKQGPVFLYSTDLEKYNKDEREFYTPIESWPFSYSSSFTRLNSTIDNFDLSYYKDSVMKHHQDLGSFEKGDASQNVVQLIQRKLREV